MKLLTNNFLPDKYLLFKKSGPVINLSDKELEELIFHFEKNHFFRMNRILDENLLQNLMSLINKLDFEETSYGHDYNIKGLEVRAKDSLILRKINFLFQNKETFRFIEKLTGCSEIYYATTRIYNIRPNTDDHLDWHEDDSVPNRKIALRINLTEGDFEGGNFQLRTIGNQKYLADLSNFKFGEACFFRIKLKSLEHRVLPVKGDKVRKTLLIWFYGKD